MPFILRLTLQPGYQLLSLTDRLLLGLLEELATADLGVAHGFLGIVAGPFYLFTNLSLGINDLSNSLFHALLPKTVTGRILPSKDTEV